MPLSSVLGAQSLVRPGVCTSSTRPASPFEGQTIYETDTDRLATWDGSAWIPYVRQTAGKVLQVVSTAKTDTFTSTSTSYADVTGLSVSITPSSTSSTVLVSSNISLMNSGDIAITFQLVRGSTAIGLGDTAGSRTRATMGYANQVANGDQMTMSFFDSPATTSSTTYKVQCRMNSGTLYVNRHLTDSDTSVFYRTISTITAMEIAG